MSAGEGHIGFSTAERALLTSVLDEIIPPSPDGTYPGAGALGVASTIEQALQPTPDALSAIVHGLADLEERARRRNRAGFTALTTEDRLEVLGDLLSADQAFFVTLIFHAYVGYYQQERVLAALGLEPRPPHPQGYEVPGTDLSLLDPVRRRPRLYRECGETGKGGG